MKQSKIDKLVKLAKKAKEAGGEAIKTQNGWKLIVSDVVWEFIKVAPKLVTELVELLENRNAKIKDLEIKLASETALRIAAEEELRQYKQNQSPYISIDGYGQTTTYPNWQYNPSKAGSSNYNPQVSWTFSDNSITRKF